MAPRKSTTAATERRNEIMDLAERLFAVQGFLNTTVESIIQESGIAKGTFYYYFESKDILLQAVLTRRLGDIGLHGSRIAADPDLSAESKLVAVLKFIFAPTPRESGNKEGNVLEMDPLMHLKLTEMFYEKIEPVLVAITEQGVLEGVFNVPYPREAARLLLRGITGYVHSSVTRRTMDNREDNPMAVIDYVLNSVLGTGRTSGFLVMTNTMNEGEGLKL
jgi:AcrR family transcriptional regulator